MLERYLKLQNCIKDVLEEIVHQNLYNSDDLEAIKDIVDVLKPMEVGVKEQSKSNDTFNSRRSF